MDEHVIIPKTEPFIGIPWKSIKNRDEKVRPVFRRSYIFPVMTDADENDGPVVDVAFFRLSLEKLTKIEFESATPFRSIDGPIGSRPTKETATYLSWAADMDLYSSDYKIVDERYMTDSDLPGDAAVIDFDRGWLSVGRVGFDHQFRFINGPEEFNPSIAPTNSFDRTIADVLKLAADIDTDQVRVRLSEDLVLELDAENLSLLIGSEPLSHVAVTEPSQPCGTPFFHHEILYQFSKEWRDGSKIVVPVCINVPHSGKDPDLGRCVPPVFMTAPGAEEGSLLRAAEIRTLPRALSLHIGVNKFSSTFSSSALLSAPAALDSCVRDAVAMQKFASTLGFGSLNNDGNNVLADTDATVTRLSDTLEEYGHAAGPGSFFLLTFSGHGMPMQLGGGGWCLNTNILLYSQLQDLLTRHFSQASRVMVISDCCHSGRIEESAEGVKEVPMRYAAAFFTEVFVPLNADKLRSISFAEKTRPAESVQPPTYFVFACGNDETIKDGGKKNLSPFTQCVRTYPHDPTVPVFETDLAACSKKSSHIVRVRRDQTWEQSEPFSMPSPPAQASRSRTR
jgi:hypothetical protein